MTGLIVLSIGNVYESMLVDAHWRLSFAQPHGRSKYRLLSGRGVEQAARGGDGRDEHLLLRLQRQPGETHHRGECVHPGL